MPSARMAAWETCTSGGASPKVAPRGALAPVTTISVSPVSESLSAPCGGGAGVGAAASAVGDAAA